MVDQVEVQVIREEALLTLREEELQMIHKKVTEGGRGEVRPEAKGEFPGAPLAARLDGLEDVQEVQAEGPMDSLEVPAEHQALRGRMSVGWPCLRLLEMYNDSRSSTSGFAEMAIVRRDLRSHGIFRRLQLRVRQRSLTSLTISKRRLPKRTLRVPRTGQSLWTMLLLGRQRPGEITSS